MLAATASIVTGAIGAENAGKGVIENARPTRAGAIRAERIA